MNAPLQPPGRAHNLSPVSLASEWSGVNNYNNTGGRSDSPYAVYSNGDSITPPDSASNAPPNFRQNSFGPPPMDAMDRRRPSDSGSRDSSRAVSIANSRSSDGTISDQKSRKYRTMEMELHKHYTVLRAYLKGGSQQPPRPNKARDKLLRLSPVQFHELSTDVFDELQRRQAAAPLPGRPPRSNNVPPFLQPRRDFHEKRNQARQKLSSLQTPRFRDLSTDVFCELERRFPQFVSRADGRPQSRGQGGRAPGPNGAMGPPRNMSNGLPSGPGPGNHHPRKGSMGGASQYEGGPHGDYKPMPRQFQSSTITPNKSTMVEDEDELHGVDSRYGRSSDAIGFDSALTSPRSDRDTSATSHSAGSGGPLSKANAMQMNDMQNEIAELRESLQAKEDEFKDFKDNGADRELRQELEKKLSDAEELTQSMKDAIDRLHAEHATTERNLRGDLESARHAASTGRSDEEVKRENEHLQQRLHQQEEIINDVRKQGRLHLEEMRAMADSGGGTFEREEKLQADVHKLAQELNQWKSKYAKAKTQVRNMRASSLGLDVSHSNAAGRMRGAELYAQDGAVKDVHMTKFQIAIDELLKIAREAEPAAVLDHMKTVVLAVQGLTTDIDNAPKKTLHEVVLKKHSKLKSKVSATANNLITASKNYAAASGLSPVSLLDAAASHLTAAVVDLVKTVKIRPTPVGELQDDDEATIEPLQGNGYFNVSDTLRRRSAVDSIYSALSSPDNGNGAEGPGPKVKEHADSSYVNGNGMNSGPPSQPGYGLGQEDADLEDLKVGNARLIGGRIANSS